MLELPPVIGHRGAAAVAPENTLAGIRKAAGLGARWVEFDVKLTADHVPILMHDDRVDRTTDGRGAVRSLLLAEIQELDAGSWFSKKFAGERVPSLAAALELCRELGLGINLELKPCPGRARETAATGLEVLRKEWAAAAPVPLISSFEHRCLEVAREVLPEIPRGYLCRRVPWNWRAEFDRHSCATLNVSQKWLRPERLAELTAEVPVLLFTVNDPAQARMLLDAGATAVFTDRVAEVLAAVA